MDDSGLGRVVSRLQLWNIDNVPAHTGCGNKAAICVVLQLVAMHVRSLIFLTSPVDTSGSGTVVGAVEIGSNDLAVVINLSVEHCSLSPWNTSIGNEDVKAAIEFLDDLVDRVAHVLGVGDVDLVGLACMSRNDEDRSFDI